MDEFFFVSPPKKTWRDRSIRMLYPLMLQIVPAWALVDLVGPRNLTGSLRPVYDDAFLLPGRFFHGSILYRGTVDTRGYASGYGRLLDTETGFTLYDGEWVADERSGFGLEFEDGNLVYQGFWQHDARHGEGVMFDQVFGEIVAAGVWNNDNPPSSNDIVVHLDVTEYPHFVESFVKRNEYKENAAQEFRNAFVCLDACRDDRGVSFENDGMCDDVLNGGSCARGFDCSDCGLRFVTRTLAMQERMLALYCTLYISSFGLFLLCFMIGCCSPTRNTKTVIVPSLSTTADKDPKNVTLVFLG
jgi:hypothetical protein